jgi:cytochrome c oxidase subunit 3
MNNKLNLNLNQNEQQAFYLVNTSPWPTMLSVTLSSLIWSFLMYFNSFKNALLFLFLSFILICFYLSQWFFDIIIESTYEGQHTEKVQKGIRFGMCLFILSEVMFFFSFFWAFLYSSLNVHVNYGDVWPPIGIYPLDYWGLPLLNTIILLSSGYTLTWSHNSITESNRYSTINSLLVTIFYGILFTSIQLYEYQIAFFRMNDSVFGSLFYLLTGFHGIHVIIGTLFLKVCLSRLCAYHFTSNHHIGYECCIWYWHFVDIVWLYLFVVIYMWIAY